MQLFARTSSMNPMTPDAPVPPGETIERVDTQMSGPSAPSPEQAATELRGSGESSLKAKFGSLLRRIIRGRSRGQSHEEQTLSDEEKAESRLWTFLGFSLTWAVSPGRLWGHESESGPCRVLFEASIIDHKGDRAQPVLRLILGRLAIWVTRA